MPGSSWLGFFSLETEKLGEGSFDLLRDTMQPRISFQQDSELLPKIHFIIAHDPWPGLSSNKEKNIISNVGRTLYLLIAFGF